MEDRWANAAGSYQFRFFSSEQIDQIFASMAKHIYKAG